MIAVDVVSAVEARNVRRMNEAPWVALNRQYLIDYYPLSLALEITRKVGPD
jgi:hypothetical protein